MNITIEQMKSLEEAAKPLVDWLQAHAHPHCKVIVEDNGAELVEAVCYTHFQVKD